MEYSKSLVLFCMLYFLIINGIESGFQFSPNKEGILGPSNLQLSCVYTVGSGKKIIGSNIQAEINGVFENIASFDPLEPDPIFLPNGTYLSLRANLSSSTSSLPNTYISILTFNQIKCEDDKKYKCLVSIKTNGVFSTEISAATRIVVKDKPAIPDNVPTWTPESGIEEGTDVTFTCTGNVGNPAGKFKWTKYRGSTATFYNNATTTAVEMSGTCTFSGTSMLTIKLEAEDNNAVIRCEVEQELATSDMYTESQPDSLVVYYKVRNIGITKSPNRTNYAEGATSITLECSAEGNPAPDFTWHKDSDMNTTLVTGKTFTLSQNDVIVNNTGNYVCVGYNTFNGKQHELTAVQHIQIDYTTTPPPTTTPSTTVTDPNATKAPQNNSDEPSLGTGSIVGIVVGLLCAIVIIVIVIVCLRKRRNRKDESIDEPPEKPRNNLSYIEKQDALGDKNGPFNNQIHYADLSFEDRPRSRKPLQLSQDADLDKTPYAEVMMPRV